MLYSNIYIILRLNDDIYKIKLPYISKLIILDMNSKIISVKIVEKYLV